VLRARTRGNGIVNLCYMLMRIVIFLSLVGPFVAYAQKVDSSINQHQLIGVWQSNSSRLGDALLVHYQFFQNGEFVYHFSEYDDANRVLALKGHYRLVGDLIYMSVHSRTERTGGYFTKGSPGFQDSPFVLEGSTIETFNQVDTVSKNDPFLLSVFQTNKTGKIIGLKIDSHKYYKLSDNPSKYDNPDKK
jgi:hypothetical protein